MMNFDDWDIDEDIIDEEDNPTTEKSFEGFVDRNNGICDPTYINGIIDCEDLGIYPWGNS